LDYPDCRPAARGELRQTPVRLDKLIRLPAMAVIASFRNSLFMDGPPIAVPLERL
jgi:hypothetical protein